MQRTSTRASPTANGCRCSSQTTPSPASRAHRPRWWARRASSPPCSAWVTPATRTPTRARWSGTLSSQGLVRAGGRHDDGVVLVPDRRCGGCGGLLGPSRGMDEQQDGLAGRRSRRRGGPRARHGAARGEGLTSAWRELGRPPLQECRVHGTRPGSGAERESQQALRPSSTSGTSVAAAEVVSMAATGRSCRTRMSESCSTTARLSPGPAGAFLVALAAPEVPALLVLGPDALAALSGVLDAQRAELDSWRELSASTDLDG
jgi:hypothetical protein